MESRMPRMTGSQPMPMGTVDHQYGFRLEALSNQAPMAEDDSRLMLRAFTASRISAQRSEAN